MVDMSRRLRLIEASVVGLFAILGAVSIGAHGPALLISVLALVAVLWALSRGTSRRRRPEYVGVAALVVAELLLAAGIIFSHGDRMLMLPILTGPAALSAATWPRRGLVFATVFTAVLMVAVALLADSSAAVNTPPLVIMPIGVLVSEVVVASAAAAADVSSRAASVLDRLTGLLNRSALRARALELAHQAALTGQPVAVIVADVDSFKQVNDRHGHAKGDAVLAGIAARLREAARSADSVYRFGGDEFVVLAPRADIAEAKTIAERVAEAVRREPIEGLTMTISLGVCAPPPGEPFDFEAIFQAADSAVYAAKDAGRGRASAAQPAKDSSRTKGEGRAGSPDHTSPKKKTRDWLVRDEDARAHLLDLQQRIRGVRIFAYSVIGIVLATAGPIYSWLPMLPPALGAVALALIIDRADRLSRPERAIGAGVILSLVANAAGFLLARGSPLCALPLLVISLFAWSPAFPTRVVVILAALNALLIALAAAVIGAPSLTSDPIPLGMPLALSAAAALVGAALGRSAVEHRGAAVVDELTGLLSRRALELRVAELAARVAQTGEPVAVLIADIDRFKRINDRHGHHRGDLVLREVAYRIRTSLRTFESVYRFGGEEFVALLVGVDAAGATAIAERIRNAIDSEPIDGLDVTISLGIAASDDGAAFQYESVFKDADAALYRAKRAGRNRVGALTSQGGDTSATLPIAA
jgi:diguanylate cyclase (GGDEF)-like protein